MRHFGKLICVLCIFLLISCTNENSHISNKSLELSRIRASSVTLTEFLSIGEKLDSLADNYSDLKIDSVLAIDYKNEYSIDTFPTDTILNVKKLNKEEANEIIKIIDSDKTYKDMIPAQCFQPHMTFVFLYKDDIVAYYSVCLGCMRVYSSLKTETIKWDSWGIGEHGGGLFSKICYNYKFSNCEYSKMPLLPSN